MQDICGKLSRTAAIVVMMFVVCAGSTWATTGVIGASNPWQIGDIVICFGTGTCNVVRIVGGHPVLENQISDAAQPNANPPIPGVSNPGFTYGVAIDNTLHVLVTDNGTSNSGGTSNIVEYTIASLNPLILTPTQVAHIPIANPSDGSGSPASGNIQAVAVNGNGELFAFNSGSANPVPTAPSIVRLTPIPNAPHTFSSTTFSLSGAGCIDTAFGLASMDLSADSSSAYFTTQGGTIQHFTFASPGCSSPFASFGPGVTLYGIADIPSGALAGVPTNCNGNACEAILVLATGSFESDGEPNVTPTPADDVNICNSTVDSGGTYCALLLSVGGPGLTASPWVAGHPYFATSGTSSMILDANLHVQQVNTPGTSVSSTQNSPHPTWKQDSTVTNDNAIVWADQGQQLWSGFLAGNLAYSLGNIAVDGAGHVQQVTQAGAPGPGPAPTFNDGTAGSTFTKDGLEWTLLCVGGGCHAPAPAWNASTQYCSTCGPGDNTIIEPACPPQNNGNCVIAFFQATVPTGSTTAGGISGGATPTFFNADGSAVASPIDDHLVIWTDEGAWTQNTTYTMTAQIQGCIANNGCVGDSNHHLWLATITGKSGPNTPPFLTNDLPNGTGQCASALLQPQGSAGCVTDGLTWSDLGTSVINRYAVSGSPKSLALDPLIRDCSNGTCLTALPSVSNFWVGDSGSSNVTQMSFSSGNPVQSFDASAVCNVQGCATFSSVQGLRIYGGEGSNQAGLTKLQCTTSQCALNSPSFTTSATFPVSAAPQDTNTWTLTAYNSTTSPIPLTLYASLINQASAQASGNNSGAADPGAVGSSVNGSQLVGNSQCQPTTTDPSKCIIWKADAPSGLPAGAYLSEAINSPTGIDNGTDIFVDMHYDITTSVGVADPVGRTYTSVHSLHEIQTQFSQQGTPSGCTYSSPVQGACYKTNRTTLNFTFQCSGPTQQQFLGLQNPPGPPLLSLIQRFPTSNPKPAPQVIQLSGTNNKAPYRYSASNNSYTFQWSLNAAAISGNFLNTKNASFRGCTFDPTNTVQTFCVDFTTSPTCK